MAPTASGGKAPVETKVTAATVASALTGLVLWLLGRYVFGDEAIPDAVVAIIAIGVPGIVTFAAGWLAPHTPRTPQDGTTTP